MVRSRTEHPVRKTRLEMGGWYHYYPNYYTTVHKNGILMQTDKLKYLTRRSSSKYTVLQYTGNVECVHIYLKCRMTFRRRRDQRPVKLRRAGV